jgi:hypothetical protein
VIADAAAGTPSTVNIVKCHRSIKALPEEISVQSFT